MNKIFIGVLFALSTFLVGMPIAQADYPDKPVTFVVPWPPGDLEDVLTRMIAEDFQDEYGVAASTGSACSIHTQKASHVLQAMGFNHEQITGSLRMSFGYLNTLDEVDQTIDVLKKVVSELRSVSPYKTKYNF